MTLLQKLYQTSFWHHVYYKHTKKHKREMQETQDRVLKLRKSILGY